MWLENENRPKDLSLQCVIGVALGEREMESEMDFEVHLTILREKII